MNATTDPPQSAPAADPRKRWQAGSLTYTTAGLSGLFFWLLWGDFAYFFKDRSVAPAVTLLLYRFHVSNFVVGFLTAALPLIIGSLMQPVVAYHSDRYRSRWGRRIPFLAATIPLTLAALAGLAISPQAGPAMHHFLGQWSPSDNHCAVIAIAASWALFEGSSTVCYAILLSLITDVVPRDVIGRFFALFRVVSLLAGILIFSYLMGHIEQHYVLLFLGVGLTYAVSFTAICLKVKEEKLPPFCPEAAGTVSGGSAGRRLVAAIRSYCRDCLTLPYYRWVFLSIALYYVATTPISTFYLFYAKSLGMSMGSVGKYGAAQFALSLVLAYPAGWLADRFHPLRVTLISLLAYAASTFAAFWLIHSATGLGVAVVLCGALSGFYLTASASLPALLFPTAKFATFNSALIVTYQVGTILAGPAAGWLLDWLHDDYRYIYLWAGWGTLLAFLATIVVYRTFLRHGGQQGYIAPTAVQVPIP